MRSSKGRLHPSAFLQLDCVMPNNFSALLQADEANFEVINNIFDQFSPIPHLCYGGLRSTILKDHESKVLAAIDNLSLQDLEDLINSTRTHKMGTYLHKICLVRCKQINIASGLCVVPITKYIGSQVTVSLQNQDICELIRTFRRLYGFGGSESRAMSGIIFKNICHQMFQCQGRIQITYIPMVRLVRDTWKIKLVIFWPGPA
jgi:hypothetical protein